MQILFVLVLFCLAAFTSTTVTAAVGLHLSEMTLCSLSSGGHVLLPRFALFGGREVISTSCSVACLVWTVFPELYEHPRLRIRFYFCILEGRRELWAEVTYASFMWEL